VARCARLEFGDPGAIAHAGRRDGTRASSGWRVIAVGATADARALLQGVAARTGLLADLAAEGRIADARELASKAGLPAGAIRVEGAALEFIVDDLW